MTRFSKGARHGSGKSVELGDKPRLFIGGLKEEVESSQLKELFENVGPVTDVFVAKGKGIWKKPSAVQPSEKEFIKL